MIGLGRYNLLVKLGQGGMGTVFLARQINLRRYCAIKIINPRIAQEAESADRFLREARSAAGLTHVNLVSIFDCDRFEDQLFIAMEYVEGSSMGEILRAYGPLPIPLALYWLNQATVGLEYIHAKSVIHRDIKPDNLLIDREGILKITDLGLAKGHSEGDTSMTMTGMVMGSPHYMSPEQINDSKTVDHRTDLYALGISFFQMLKGHVPFQHSSAAAICVAHMQEPIPSLALPDPELTASLDGLIAQMTAKNRDERIGSAADLLGILKPWLEAYPMDREAQNYFGQFDFSGRAVPKLLEAEGIDGTTVDLDLTPESDTAPKPAVIPEPSHPVRSFPKWAIPSLAAIAIVLLLFVAVEAKKRASRRAAQPTLPAAQAAAPVKAEPPAPKVESKPPVEIVPAVAPKPAAPKTGGLFVKTAPSQAIILFRADSAPSPATFKNIPIGEHTVKISLPGHKEVQKKVVIEEEKFTELDVKLERIHGIVHIESKPSGAEVIVDGRLLGTTPYRLEGGEGETFKCLLRHEGYQDASMDVVLKQEEEILTAKLVPIPPSESAANAPQPSPMPRPEPGIPGNPPMTGEGAPVSDQGYPPPTGPAQKMMELRTAMENNFDRAVEAPRTQWSTTRNAILTELEKELKERRPGDASGVARARKDIAKILDEIKTKSPHEAQSRREEYVMRMTESVMQAMRSGKGPFQGGRAPRW